MLGQRILKSLMYTPNDWPHFPLCNFSPRLSVPARTRSLKLGKKSSPSSSALITMTVKRTSCVCVCVGVGCVGVWVCVCVCVCVWVWGVWVCGCVGVWVCGCVYVWVCVCVGVCGWVCVWMSSRQSSDFLCEFWGPPEECSASGRRKF